MSEKRDNPIRGRPKKLDREHVLQTAMMCYWADGPTNVSINDICLKADASKPSVYREFGSDDGLKGAVLDTYRSMVSMPLYELLDSDQPFEQVLEALISFTIQDRQALGVPNGCLYVDMRAHHDELGEIARKKVDKLRDETLENYERFIERAKSKGELSVDMPTEIAALYFDAQNAGAMRLQKEGVSNATIGEVLRLAFSVFR